MVDSLDDSELATLMLRPTASSDRGFMRELFLDAHALELAHLADLAPALLDQQYDAWLQNLAHYAPLRDDVIVLCERPIGRLLVSNGDTRLYIVDLMIVPGSCGRGVGTQILRRLQTEASARQVPVELRVRRSNRAQSLFTRLGFEVADRDATHLTLRWESSLGK